ncbi:hypothetical protein AC579_8865 [Pseudocercospora musae]|uniref:Uncharacterized protein n=1 Tax=Pseudocercospora musae TaxID=113226 RepID=A0A139IH04_9PEZI|nr:hypothetical protein AC579_8865 [Pseudocercospora musae]
MSMSVETGAGGKEMIKVRLRMYDAARAVMGHASLKLPEVSRPHSILDCARGDVEDEAVSGKEGGIDFFLKPLAGGS